MKNSNNLLTLILKADIVVYVVAESGSKTQKQQKQQKRKDKKKE